VPKSAHLRISHRAESTRSIFIQFDHVICHWSEQGFQMAAACIEHSMFACPLLIRSPRPYAQV
jgi:hypothetical protein